MTLDGDTMALMWSILGSATGIVLSGITLAWRTSKWVSGMISAVDGVKEEVAGVRKEFAHDIDRIERKLDTLQVVVTENDRELIRLKAAERIGT